MQGILKPFEVRDRRAKERFMIDDEYLNGWAKKCKAHATAVYMSLCLHGNVDQYCWPSIKKIGEEHSMSPRQVRYALDTLKKYHLIEVERLGKKLNNRYWLVDKSEWSNGQDMPLTTAPYATHPLHHMPLHSKDTQYKDTQYKVFFSDDKKTMMQKYNENESYQEPAINTDTGELEGKIEKQNQNAAWSEFITYWKSACKKMIGIIPNVNLKSDKPTFHRIMKLHGEEQMKNMVTFFLKSEKAQKHLTIHACFSADSINAWKLGEGARAREEAKKFHPEPRPVYHPQPKPEMFKKNKI